MWIMLNDAFLSIVSKDCPRDSLLVRARRKGDIEKIFPKASVKRSLETDYMFRAAVPREEVERAITGEVRRINYSNFKDSVGDHPLHLAYLRVWNAMAELQPLAGSPAGIAHSSLKGRATFSEALNLERPRKPRRKLTKGR